MSNFLFAIGIIGFLVIGLVIILIIGLNSLKRFLLVASPFLILAACSALCVFFSKYLFLEGEPLLYIILYILVLFFVFYIVSRVTDNTDQSKKEDASDESAQTDTNSTQWPKDEPIKEDRLSMRNRVFVANSSINYNDPEKKELLYTSAVSVIALFSWVMRRDGSVNKEEMNVAKLYFHNRPTYNKILKLGPNKVGWDPVLGTNRTSTTSPTQLLDYYSTWPKLLQYETCCRNILASGIYYGAVMDLLKALFQVAYSSDGVNNSEMKILRGIAENLKVKKEDWKFLVHKFEFYNSSFTYEDNLNENMNTKHHKSSDNQGKSSSKEGKNTDKNGQKRNDEKESKQKKEKLKSTTYGYKITQAYNQLGLLTTATEPEIKAAFRLLAKKYHPDRLPSDATDMERKISEDQFRLVMEAYDLIRMEKGI